jgi:hypothetical protein
MTIDALISHLDAVRNTSHGKYVAHLPACVNCVGDDDYDELRIGRHEH